MKSIVRNAVDHLPEPWQHNLMVWGFGLLKVPLIWYVRPTVLNLDQDEVVIRIPLNRRTKNHLNCMYFGVLAVGADLAGGLLGMYLLQKRQLRIAMLFKDFQADFLRRAEGDVHFQCRDGQLIDNLVQQAVDSGDRVNGTVSVQATVPSKLGDEPVAEFKLTLSMKMRK